jgi:hypothetical protein
MKRHDFIPDEAGLSCRRCLLPARNAVHDKSGVLERLTNSIRATMTDELAFVIEADRLDKIAGRIAENILTAEPLIWK